MEFGMKLRKTPSKTRTSRSTCTNKLGKKIRKTSTSKRKKCVCLPQKIGPKEYLAVWTELRKNNQLCDGTVRCQDGSEFKIHRIVLSAVSPYFRALFTNSINRGQPEAKEAYMNVPPDIFNTLLDFAYTGTCQISSDNVEPLLRYADQYEVLGVIQMCCQYILDHLLPSNCLGVLNFARHYFCRDLEQRGKLFVRHNFADVIKESKEFVNLNVNELIEILDDDDLNIKSEEVAFDAVKMWVEHDPELRKCHLLSLIKTVRLGTLTYSYVFEITKWIYVIDDEGLQEYLFSVLDIIENYRPDRSDIVNNNITRPRIPYDILFAIGGWSAGSPTNFIETYDTRADCWLLSTDTDSSPRAYHGLCALNGLIYMIGGFDGNEHFNTVRCFNPLDHTWKECACMYYPRCYVSVVMHANKIYAMGGYNGRIRMSSVERYDPSTNQWELIPPMQRQRSDASAAALQDKIYIVGGFNGQEVMSSAEIFDTLTNQWSYIPRMISARSGVSLVAFRNSIYAIGGFNGFTRLTTSEKFMPGQSTGWVEIAEMMTPRSNFATVILDENIYVIGGFNDQFVAGSTTISYVECYDPEANEWFDTSPMNLNRSALSACVISGLPNAREYSFVGRNSQQQGQGEKRCLSNGPSVVFL